MMNPDFLDSILIASILFLGFYQALRLKTEKTATYRLFLIFFLSGWSAILWIQPYRPTAGLLTISIGLMVLLFILAFIPKRAPKNRRETKELLEQLQKEKWLETFFESDTGRLFWLILAFLIWSVCYRLVAIY